MIRPHARKNGVLTTELDDELIVYDTDSKWAHSLNLIAACVWRHCDGRHSIGDLQRVTSVEVGALVDEEAIVLALRQLDQAHLLVEAFPKTGLIVTRREMLRSARRVGAAAVVAPIVFSALVPVPAAAASCIACQVLLPQPCVVGGTPCCNGCSCQPSQAGGLLCLPIPV